MTIRDHLVGHDHVQEVLIAFHHHITINSHHHREIIIEHLQEIIISMIEGIIVINQITRIITEMIIAVVIMIDLVKQLIYIQIVNLD